MGMVFIASEPNWKCKNNSTCPFTKSISIRDKKDYKFRCNISREDWEFVDDFTSVVTEVCAQVMHDLFAYIFKESSFALLSFFLFQ